MKNLLYFFVVAMITESCAHQEEFASVESVEAWFRLDTIYATNTEGCRDMMH